MGFYFYDLYLLVKANILNILHTHITKPTSSHPLHLHINTPLAHPTTHSSRHPHVSRYKRGWCSPENTWYAMLAVRTARPSWVGSTSLPLKRPSGTRKARWFWNVPWSTKPNPLRTPKHRQPTPATRIFDHCGQTLQASIEALSLHDVVPRLYLGPETKSYTECLNSLD